MRVQVNMALLLYVAVNLENGDVQQEVLLPNKYFGEGLTVVNDSLVQLTWQNNIGFVYDKETFGLLGNFSYSY